MNTNVLKAAGLIFASVFIFVVGGGVAYANLIWGYEAISLIIFIGTLIANSILLCLAIGVGFKLIDIDFSKLTTNRSS